MARTSATISVGADTRQLERDIQGALSRDFKLKGLNEKAFTQPLGRITGSANEFQKSLDASNARVIAFGASAGLIFTVEKAFTSLVKSTIDVQKSLTDINVILNVSATSLDKFGNSLFDIAKNTGQSFDVVAVAATELSRQGLGLEETLKRTQDALILTRLSGLDTASAVEALTATINSFNKAGLDSTTIINKLANVDAAFAVSSGDLAEAIKRVGSSASDAGVGFDELLAIVTSVQQTTARGGAVIGNSLKTIFTRIQRTDTLDQLQDLGIEVRDLEGNTLPAIQVLSNLSNTFNKLGDSQRAQLGETVGGVFQINILKAALADLGKEYSVYDRALQTSANSTDQAIQRNEALNQTLSALINQTFQNLTRVSSSIGQISLGPTFKNTLDLLNKGLESLSSDSTSVGGKIGKGILEGIGTFISGPGLILITAVFGKLLLNLGKFAAQSLGVLLNINTQSEQRAQIQAKINEVLAKEPSLVAAIYSKQISVLEVENQILNIIRLQTIERAKAAAVSSTIAGGLIGRGVSTKGGSLKASAGFIPNFSASEVYGALAGGYAPGNIRKMNIPGEGNVTYNSAETVKNFKGMSQPAIMPPKDSKAGKNYEKQFSSAHGFNPYASQGFVPNFALGRADTVRLAASNGQLQRIGTSKTFQYGIDSKGNPLTLSEAEKNDILQRSPRGQAAAAAAGIKPLDVSSIASVLLPFIGSSRLLAGPYSPKGKSDKFAIKNIPVYGMKKATLDGDTADDKIRLGTNITNNILDSTSEFINTLKPLGKTVNRGVLASQFSSSGEKGAYGAVRGAIGSAFEVAIKTALKYTQEEARKDFGDFDVRGGRNLGHLQKLFGFKTPLADFKGGLSEGNLQSFANKIYREKGALAGLGKFSTIKGKSASTGFIPNFAALDDAIGREAAAGTPTSRIRIGKNARLTSSANPLGLGVYNTKDEPLGLGQGVERYGSKAKTAGAAAGFIPNFAELSFNPGGLGALDPSVASREVGARFRVILNKLKAQELTLDQANLNLKQLTANYGLAANSQNKFNQVLQTRATQYSSSAKSASLALDNSKKGFEKIGGAALALSFVLPIAVQTVSQFNEKNKKAQVALDSFSTFLSLTAAGAVFGLPGAAAGAGAGLTLAIMQFFKGMKDLKIETLNQDLQLLIDKYNDTSTSLNKVLPLLEKYKEIQASSLPDTEKTEALTDVQNQITENLSKAGPAIVDAVTQALAKGDWALAAYNINKGVSESLAATTNAGIKTLFEQAKINGVIESKAQATATAKALTGGVTSSGKNIIQDFASKPENLPVMENVSKDLYKLLTERGKLQEKQSMNQTLEQGFSLGLAAEDPELRRKVQKEILDTEILLKTNLQNIVNKTEPLYQATDETRAYFQEISQLSKDTGLSINAADIIIKDTKGYIDSTKKSAQKIDYALKTDGIKDVAAYIAAFRKGTLNAADAQKYYKDLFAKQNPLDVLGKNQDALNMSVQSTFLNKNSQDKVLDELTIQQEKLRAKLANRQITEDQYNKALEGLKDEIILEQRRSGTIFAEDFRGGRQTARENKALAGQTQLEDFAGAFFDEFDNSSADSFRQIQLGAKDTANTIKSEFNASFLDFANGTATAGDAFTRMANNISDKIQQLALEFSTNLIFSKLLGTSSNLFGGGGGGGFNLGSLFGFKKGGVVKGYSSGGNVTGGSGMKDDVPAMLNAGEYVLKKSAVNKYGKGFLGMLNGGAVPKFADGGELQNTFQNTYLYNDPFRPTSGGSAIDSRLSLEAITDENNPMNRVRIEREMDFLNYIKYVEDIDAQNQENEKAYWERKFEAEKARLEAWQQETQRRQEMQNQYNNMLKKKEQGNWMQFGMGALGAGLSFFKEGGPVKHFAKGGKNEDNVPAMLMDGEFVLQKQAVNTYGKDFLDKLNSGRIKKFASGGQVGSPSVYNEQDIGGTTNSTNNVNVTVNVTKSGGSSENSQDDSSASDRDENDKERQRTKALAEKVKVQVLKVITEQQRPGGLLYKSR